MTATDPRPKLSKPGRMLMLGASIAMLAACGEGEEDAGANAITIVGSSTVFPFAQKVAEDFVAGNEGMVAPLIESTGTTEGIESFCAGQGPETPDIVNASRRMTITEFNGCANNGVTELVEIKVGRDGIAFASSAEDGIDLELTGGIIYSALAANPFGEEQSAANWSDVEGSLPNEPIVVYGPPSTSGTRDALLALILMPACKTNPTMAGLELTDPQEFEKDCNALRSDSAYIDQGEQDDLIVRKVANNPRAIGVFGYSYLEENSDTVKGLPMGGVLPTAETIADGSYPASRPLYIYVKKAHVGVTPGIQEYLNQWSQSWSADGPLTAIGLVPATDEVQTESAAAVSGLTVMTGEGLES